MSGQRRPRTPLLRARGKVSVWRLLIAAGALALAGCASHEQLAQAQAQAARAQAAAERAEAAAAQAQKVADQATVAAQRATVAAQAAARAIDADADRINQRLAPQAAPPSEPAMH